MRSIVKSTIMGYLEKYWAIIIEGLGAVFALPCMLVFRHSFGERIVRLRYIVTQHIGFKILLFLIAKVVVLPETVPAVIMRVRYAVENPLAATSQIRSFNELKEEQSTNSLSSTGSGGNLVESNSLDLFNIPDPYLFTGIFLLLFAMHRFGIFQRNRKNVEWYSESFGTSRLYKYFSPIRHIIGHREVQIFVEPLILLLIGLAFLPLSDWFALYFLIASAVYFAFEMHRYGKQREEYLQLRDYSLKGRAYERIMEKGWEGAIQETGSPMYEIDGLQIERPYDTATLSVAQSSTASLDDDPLYQDYVQRNKSVSGMGDEATIERKALQEKNLGNLI